MSTGATSESFERELNRLAKKFGRNFAELKGPNYHEAKLRPEYAPLDGGLVEAGTLSVVQTIAA